MKDGTASLIKRFQSATSFGVLVVNEVSELYRQQGDTLYDPQVTQMQHALQSAALAEADGADDALVVATLLHDVGHLLLEEHAGHADFLARDQNHEDVRQSGSTRS